MFFKDYVMHYLHKNLKMSARIAKATPNAGDMEVSLIFLYNVKKA